MSPRPALANLSEQISTMADQELIGVTIYNNNLALVKERRTLTLDSGINLLAYTEVSAQIQPESAIMRSVSHSNSLTVLEQNFDFDLLTPQKLLEKFVGRQIGVVKTHPTTGEETTEEAQVLSTNNGAVLKIGSRIETGGAAGRLIFPNVPENLRERPTLSMTLQSQTDEQQTVELSYLTGGLSWRADYVAELAGDDTLVDVNGWVTLTNTSGTLYRNALLQLVAGDVHQVPRYEERDRRLMVKDIEMAAQAPQMAEEGLFEYHLYTLARPTTILDNQTKQVSLLQAGRVPVDKEYVLMGRDYYYRNRYSDLADSHKIAVYLKLVNSKDNGLGLPLPKGVVRVYKKDSKNRIQFIGEDRIDHTPENENIRLKLGNAFDVTAQKKQTDFTKLSGFSRYNYVMESSYEVIIKNAKETAVTVKVVEPMPGDWEILEENITHQKESSSAAFWMVDVPPKGEASLLYRVRVQY
jgi:hypothetical protein